MSEQNMLERVKETYSKLHFGVEVEVNNISSYDHSALYVINNMFEGRERWSHVHDGSVYNGSEFVSGIMKPESLEKVAESVRIIRRHGGRAHESCGIHVHVDAAMFLNGNLKGLVNLIKMVNKYQDHLYHALGASETRRTRWAKPVEESFMREIDALKPSQLTIERIKEAWYRTEGIDTAYQRYNRSRYRGLNLHALFTKGTVEFRWYESTVHAGKIKSYIQLSMLMVATALNTTKGSSIARPFDINKGKYEMRTFLLKIHAMGDEFKTMRFHLTDHLLGSSAFHAESAPQTDSAQNI